jgi:hypothetical protein
LNSYICSKNFLTKKLKMATRGGRGGRKQQHAGGPEEGEAEIGKTQAIERGVEIGKKEPKTPCT